MFYDVITCATKSIGSPRNAPFHAYAADGIGGDVYEHGVMVTLKTRSASLPTQFWVVGRICHEAIAMEGAVDVDAVEAKSNTQEVFVCFQDGTPASVIEMAFQLQGGVP